MQKNSTKNPQEFSRMKNRADFLRLRNKGQSIASKSLVLQYAPSANIDGKALIGFTATKKIGKANIRNRAKRRLREAIAKKQLILENGYDIVLIARMGTALRTWDKLLADLDKVLKEARLINKKD